MGFLSWLCDNVVFPSLQSFRKDVAMATEIGSPPRFFHMPRFQHQAPRQLFYKRPDFAQQQAMQQLTFDGKRMRKAVNRKTIDYNPSVIKYLEVSKFIFWFCLEIFFSS